MHGRSLMAIDPSILYNVGTEHSGFSPIRQRKTWGGGVRVARGRGGGAGGALILFIAVAISMVG